MADPTPEERRKEAAEIFADGMELYENRRAERIAKEQAANPPKEDKGDDTSGTDKPFFERILGW